MGADAFFAARSTQNELAAAVATAEASMAVTNELISNIKAVSYTHLRAHETVLDLVCRLLLEKKKKAHNTYIHQPTSHHTAKKQNHN